MTPAELVDLARYPFADPAAPAARALAAGCREALATTGACELPGFLRPEVVASLVAEATALVPRAHRHAGKATPYLELPDPGWPEGHPRVAWNPFSLGAVAYDDVPEHSDLRRLYAWDGLLDWLADALGLPQLHRYADPLGCCSLNVMEDGDEVEWHFDQADFVVSLALQDAEEGGDFLVVPKLRRADDENYAGVARALSGDPPPVRLPMNPGTLLLFNGRESLHCVSPCRGATPRLVALLAYDTKPGTCASEMLQKIRYGRAKRPEAA